MVAIEGTVAPGWEPVRDAFADGFTNRGEVGAGVSVVHRGMAVVDLVGGHRDRDGSVPYGDALQLVFSTTKGMTSLCVAICVERGWIDPEAPVRSLWTRFPADISVAQLMSHQAGLAAVDADLTLAQLLDWDEMITALEQTTPMWDPGSAHGYHAFTFGWLAGELVRRADPAGRSLGRFLAEEVVTPLGIEMWIGLPPEQQARVARLFGPPIPTDPELVAALARRSGPGTLGQRAFSVSRTFISSGVPWNDPAVRAAEIPGANGITNARSLARMYGSLVSDGPTRPLLRASTIEMVRTPQVSGHDLCLDRDTRFGLGFMLDSPTSPMLSPGSFGHTGAGGSLGFADPERQIGFGYVMNQMHDSLSGDPRPAALVAAVQACLTT